MSIAGLVLLTLAIGVVPASAQRPGRATFRVLQKGDLVGTVEVSVDREDEGWRIRSTGRVGGTINLATDQLDVQYDASWRLRFMTMEMSADRPKNHIVVHVAMMGTMTRTDTVIPGTSARVGTNRVSPNTIAVPDYAFGAFEALAARLSAITLPGIELPLFNPPGGEITASVEAIEDLQVRTDAGVIVAKRYRLLALKSIPTPIDVWIDRGRLVRLDLPLEELSVFRDDVEK